MNKINTQSKNIIIILWLVIIYFLLKYMIPYWNYIIYPITLLVTFLHEFWHSLWALITWWSVYSIEISSNWAGLATTSWWWRSIVLMWGYIWSAILWNLLLYIWVKKQKYSELVIYLLSWIMIFTAVFWYSWITTSIILFLISFLFIFLAKYTNYDSIILQFLWVASILYIIEDFNVWPTSDLAKFSDIFVIFPEFIWMYLWLFIVLFITYLNLKNIFKK